LPYCSNCSVWISEWWSHNCWYGLAIQWAADQHNFSLIFISAILVILCEVPDVTSPCLPPSPLLSFSCFLSINATLSLYSGTGAGLQVYAQQTLCLMSSEDTQ
jgi:hypothetical protein